MKRFLFFAVVLLSALTCSAGFNKANMKVAYTAKTAGKVDFTVLNKVNDKGFVILDSQDQVLGYSDAGTFDYDKMPESLKWWLRQYQEQINWARTNGVQGSRFKVQGSKFKAQSPKSQELNPEDSVIVQPLLGDTQWGQSSPYCIYCPLDGAYYSVVGCVATAMSQIMYYHKWPLKGHGYHEYTLNGKTNSRNFGESTYDWDNILPRYSGVEYTNDQAKAVARLCADAGISVDMNYSASGSGTSSTMASIGFVRNFFYSGKTHCLSQADRPKEEWDSILVAELDAARPILYCGSDAAAGGHAFVCDGYTRDGFFHFNWGWNGSGDGYFKTGALNVKGYKFNATNVITVGIEPRSTVVVDGFAYEILSDSTVMFTYRDDYEYTEPVVVPLEVSIDGKTYKVSSLAPGCLSEQVVVPSIQVQWTTPPMNVEKVFSSFACDNTVLIVPDNCVDAYAKSPGWNRFRCIKDNIGHRIEWGDWESFGEGKGTYTYMANPMFAPGTDDPGLPISFRRSKSDDGQWQFWIQHWSYDTDFYIGYDSITGNCTVSKQYGGYDFTPEGEETTSVYVSDLPSFSPEYSYEEYPCKFDPENGLFTLNLFYLYGGKNFDAHQVHGFEKFQIDGYATDMFATYDFEHTFGKKIGVRISVASGIKSCKYAFVEGEISQDSAAVVAQQIADSLIGSKPAVIGLSTYKPASLSETYTMVIAGFDRNGKYRNYTTTILNYNDIYDMKLGDANKDGAIDVSDITTTASYILGEKPASFNRFSADIDKDGAITVADITAIAAMILGSK